MEKHFERSRERLILNLLVHSVSENLSIKGGLGMHVWRASTELRSPHSVFAANKTLKGGGLTQMCNQWENSSRIAPILLIWKKL